MVFIVGVGLVGARCIKETAFGEIEKTALGIIFGNVGRLGAKAHFAERPYQLFTFQSSHQHHVVLVSYLLNKRLPSHLRIQIQTLALCKFQAHFLELGWEQSEESIWVHDWVGLGVVGAGKLEMWSFRDILEGHDYRLIECVLLYSLKKLLIEVVVLMVSVIIELILW